jgi:predicted metal-binding membrane protein
VAQAGQDSADRSPQGTVVLVARQPGWAIGTLVVALLAWTFLAWIAVDMGHPIAQLTMPASSSWTASNVLAIWSMWAVMMAAMMLPSAVPMILTFINMSTPGGQTARGHSFVAAYLSVWFVFSAGAATAQWVLQLLDWVDPMILSTSSLLNGALLLIAGLYQFSPLKRICLSRCRTPMGFLLGEWRPGVRGAFIMGARHGLLCVGCCWALMALLFVGGVMNLAWVAALSIAVSLEKLLPRGDRLAAALGIVLIVLGGIKLATVWG